MANNIVCRDIRVADHMHIRLKPSDTWYRVFYGDDTEPTELGLYDHKNHMSYGYSPLDGDWFAVSHTSEGGFLSSSTRAEFATSFPADIRKQLVSL